MSIYISSGVEILTCYGSPMRTKKQFIAATVSELRASDEHALKTMLKQHASFVIDHFKKVFPMQFFFLCFY